jgi:hypothetical protein
MIGQIVIQSIDPLIKRPPLSTHVFDQRHRGEDRALLASRHQVYELARTARPERWSGCTRNWHPVGAVWLNPERADAGHKGHGVADALLHEAGGGDPMVGPANRTA